MLLKIPSSVTHVSKSLNVNLACLLNEASKNTFSFHGNDWTITIFIIQNKSLTLHCFIWYYVWSNWIERGQGQIPRNVFINASKVTFLEIGVPIKHNSFMSLAIIFDLLRVNFLRLNGYHFYFFYCKQPTKLYLIRLIFTQISIYCQCYTCRKCKSYLRSYIVKK